LLTVTAQPMWAETNWIGALFMASAASTGAASIGLAMALRRKPAAQEAAERLTRMDNAAIGIEIVVLVLVLATATTMAGALLTGSFAIPFWAFVLAGIVIPLALQLRVSFGGAHPPASLMIVASALVLIGGFIIRYAILMVAQS